MIKNVNLTRMRDKKWGVMVHFLEGLQNNPASPTNDNVGVTSWDELVNGVDVDNVARQLKEMNAGWLLITLCQGQKYMIAPNKTYDGIIGATAGEACSQRDLPMDLYYALKKYDIDLYLYFTNDGPHLDETAGSKMGYYSKGETPPLTEKYLKNWSAVLREYAERYKGKVKGWWIDGCYRNRGCSEETLKYYNDVLKSADPNYLVAYNDGNAIGTVLGNNERYDINGPITQETKVEIYSAYKYDDYTPGEVLDFMMYPSPERQSDVQWHILSPLSGDGAWGCGWAKGDVKYSYEYFSHYLDKVWKNGGVVTVEMGLKRSGAFFEPQKRFMQKVTDDLIKNK